MALGFVLLVLVAMSERFLDFSELGEVKRVMGFIPGVLREVSLFLDLVLL